MRGRVDPERRPGDDRQPRSASSSPSPPPPAAHRRCSPATRRSSHPSRQPRQRPTTDVQRDRRPRASHPTGQRTLEGQPPPPPASPRHPARSTAHRPRPRPSDLRAPAHPAPPPSRLCVRAAVAASTARGARRYSTPRHAATAPTLPTNTATAALGGSTHPHQTRHATRHLDIRTSRRLQHLRFTTGSPRTATPTPSPHPPVDGRSRPARSAAGQRQPQHPVIPPTGQPARPHRPVQQLRLPPVRPPRPAHHRTRHLRRTPPRRPAPPHAPPAPAPPAPDPPPPLRLAPAPMTVNVGGSNAAKSTRISTRSINGPDNRPR